MPSSSSSSSSDDEQTKKRFQIVCRSSQHVLDIEGNKKTENVGVILYESKKRHNRNQLWYVDKDGYIRSYLSRLTLYADDTHQPVKTSKKFDDPRGQWSIQGNHIVNRKGWYLDTMKKSTAKGAELSCSGYDGGFSQQWEIKYV